MTKNDVSLVEVWDWKDAVYREIKGLSVKGRLAKIQGDAEKILTDNHIDLKSIVVYSEHLKSA